ncbi:MAG TPA: STAS domain-containing protein, partial [Terriglobales bacterium]|nr:STAS domain-containing protein [Terriglobales bacterium]
PRTQTFCEKETNVLKVSVNHVGNAAILKCEGRIVRGEESRLLCAAIGSSEAIFDLSAVEAIDAAGVGMLVSLQAAGVYLTLLNPNESVGAVLQLTGLDTVFDIRRGETLNGILELIQLKAKPVAPMTAPPAALAS